MERPTKNPKRPSDWEVKIEEPTEPSISTTQEEAMRRYKYAPRPIATTEIQTEPLQSPLAQEPVPLDNVSFGKVDAGAVANQIELPRPSAGLALGVGGIAIGGVLATLAGEKILDLVKGEQKPANIFVRATSTAKVEPRKKVYHIRH